MQVSLFGKKSIKDALNNSSSITIYTIDKNTEFKNNPNVVINYVKKSFFDKFSEINHQFYYATIDIKINEFSLEDLIDNNAKYQKQMFLVLDEIQDPRNFGAILRTALAFNVNGVIYKKNNQVGLDNNLVIKTSLGAIHNLNFCQVVNLNRTIDILKQKGYWTYATNLSPNSVSVNDLEFDNRTVLIIGNENKGVSKSLIKNSDFEIKINTTNKIQSLNVSVACGILLNKFYNAN